MTLEQYNNRLKQVPAWDSDEFIPWIKENNVVVYENSYWVIVENCKYHTSSNPHYTAFSTEIGVSENSAAWLMAAIEFLDCEGWFKYENSTANKTLKRPHFHIVRNQSNWLELMYKLQQKSVD